jgi:hypothetical protein
LLQIYKIGEALSLVSIKKWVQGFSLYFDITKNYRLSRFFA